MSEPSELLQRQALRAEAEARIQRLLVQLEKDTNSHIKTIEIEEIDYTGLADNRRQYVRRLVIDLEPLPGYGWA